MNGCDRGTPDDRRFAGMCGEMCPRLAYLPPCVVWLHASLRVHLVVGGFRRLHGWVVIVWGLILGPARGGALI